MSKLKKLGLSVILVLSVLTVNINVFASSLPEKVRIGLSSNYANKESITISNNSLYIGYNGENDFLENGTLTSSSGFTVQMPDGYYVDCNVNADTYEDALDMSYDFSEYGYDAVPAITGGDDWTVYLCNIPSISEAEKLTNTVGGRAVTATTSIIEIEGSNGIVAVSDGIYPQFEPTSGYITLGSKSYRGTMEFGRYNNSFITAVNIVTIDQYLYGTVPAEMPYTWHEEALKAQIIAARSYTYTRLTAHTKDGYQLCDTTNCQLYNGVNAEKTNVNKLVDETSGILALYNGSPINAVFCSSSGGHTDNCENVWSEAVAYLRGVKEIFGTKGTSWSRTFSASEISELCSEDGKNVGSVNSIDITVSSLTGRVQQMTVNGSNGSYTLKKDAIRSFFSSKGGYLPSRMFTLNGLGITDYDGAVYTEEDVIILSAVSEEIASNYDTSGVFSIGGQKFALDGKYTPTVKSIATDELKTFTASGSSYNFSGYGSGHGIGMSQYGAKEMAENGYTYTEILKHYYTGIEIK